MKIWQYISNEQKFRNQRKHDTTSLKERTQNAHGRLVRGSTSIRPAQSILRRLIIQACQIRIYLARSTISTAWYRIKILENYLKRIYSVCGQEGPKTSGFEKA